MVIKSQKDVVEATKSSKKRAEDKIRNANPTPDMVSNVDERIKKIESYLTQAAPLIKQLERSNERLDIIETEFSKLVSEFTRVIEIEDDRYIELANVINHMNEKINVIDSGVAPYIDNKIETKLNEYFDESVTPVQQDGVEEEH